MLLEREREREEESEGHNIWSCFLGGTFKDILSAPTQGLFEQLQARTKGRMKKRRLLIWCLLGMTVQMLCTFADSTQKTQLEPIDSGRKHSTLGSAVELHASNNQQVVLDNGLVRVILASPEGHVLGVTYQGVDNVLESHNDEDDRGYLDVVWNEPGGRSTFERIKGTAFHVVMENEDQVEVSFQRTWDISLRGSSVPMNIDKRYILQRGSSGFYSYAIFERPEGWPAVEIDQIRIVYKLQESMFHYMAVSDERQRTMPMPEDRASGQPLAYPEAVLLTNPVNPDLRGEVDDKYQYSCENKDNRVHGWISTDANRDKSLGFWMITPSNEFRNAGPIKQDLTSHVGPVVLSMFVSTHYAGKEVTMAFSDGEPYKKVFGPVYTYLNSISSEDNSLALWTDAKRKMVAETRSWPYDFPQSEDYLPAPQRGNVAGQLLVDDRYINGGLLCASSAFVGLALPGEVGSWQRESKGYQFWTRANKRGYFLISNIIPGNYSLYAWVPGVIGDYKYETVINITQGCKIKLGPLVYRPPRNGPTLWEIGIPDRTSAEFYIPDPYPTLMNQLYTNDRTDKFRQYGLWERYADLYPNSDLVYNVDVDDYRKDWFFAHVTRDVGNRTYQSTTWQIVFGLENVNDAGTYTLQLALASVTDSNLQVRINDPRMEPPHFSTGAVGKDNAIARHGIHGLYWLHSILIPGNLLVNGNNTMYLTQSRNLTAFAGIMYDYIRLESPSS